MNDYTRKLLDKAVDTIEGAELLLDHGKTDLAAGRAYYALFYETLLNEKGLQFSKHGDVIGAYGKEFSKTKLLDQKFHRWLRTGFDARLIGDYHEQYLRQLWVSGGLKSGVNSAQTGDLLKNVSQ